MTGNDKQIYNPETRDAIIELVQKLQDVVGYHFPWCNKCECDCGMKELRIAKYKLQKNQFDEFELWHEALGK